MLFSLSERHCGCTRTLSTFTAPGGSACSTIEEFADCNLVVVTTNGSSGMQDSVYDRSTGALVGRRIYSDVIEKCPFDGSDTGSHEISGGQLRIRRGAASRARCRALEARRSAAKTGPKLQPDLASAQLKLRSRDYGY